VSACGRLSISSQSVVREARSERGIAYRVKLFDLWVQRMTLRLVAGVSQGAAKANESGSKDRIAGYCESDMARRYLNAS